MAIDTRDKRASTMAAGIAAITVFPTPDTSVDAEDRSMLSGLFWRAAGAAVEVADNLAEIVGMHRRRAVHLMGRV